MHRSLSSVYAVLLVTLVIVINLTFLNVVALVPALLNTDLNQIVAVQGILVCVTSLKSYTSKKV